MSLADIDQYLIKLHDSDRLFPAPQFTYGKNTLKKDTSAEERIANFNF